VACNTDDPGNHAACIDVSLMLIKTLGLLWIELWPSLHRH
jgi:hypothetical protein